MAKIILTNIDSLDSHNLELLSNYLAKKGLEFAIVGDSVSFEPTPAPQKTTKAKSAPKSKAKKDDFDRVTYQKVASVMGCLGKHGVWKCCRQWVYAVMDGSMDIDTACKKVADLKAEKGWA